MVNMIIFINASTAYRVKLLHKLNVFHLVFANISPQTKVHIIGFIIVSIAYKVKLAYK